MACMVGPDVQVPFRHQSHDAGFGSQKGRKSLRYELTRIPVSMARNQAPNARIITLTSSVTAPCMRSRARRVPQR